MVTVRRAALLLTLPLLLAGCGGGSPTPDRSAPASAPLTSSATEAPSSSSDGAAAPEGDGAGTGEPAAPPPASEEPEGGLPAFGSEPAEAGTSGEPALGVAAVRAARHEGFDRVVVELAGRGDPGWFVQQVDAPTRQGSGDPVEMAGEAFLVLVVRGVGYPQDTGVPEYTGPRELVPSDTAVLREVEVGGSFEGDWDASVGLAADRPYRVFSLADPPRVVLDVAHEG